MKKTAILISISLFIYSNIFANTSAKQSTELVSNNNTHIVAQEYPSQVKTIDKQLKGAEILQALTKDYEGKVVLFDFWATWCGPCRAAMKKLDEIKPELQKKGVAFVYVTGETSPLKNWQAMIPNIKGDHYRLTNNQWSDLCNQLGIPGIPAYMLLNKDGSVAYSNLSTGGYPGSEILQNNIEVALTK